MAAPTPEPTPGPASGPAVVVIGAGVVGAAVTYALARRGARVRCLDRAAAAGLGVTAVGFAAATAYRRFPSSYFALNRAGIAAHARWADELGGAAWWRPCGTLALSDEESHAGYLAQLREWGCDVRPLGRRAALLPEEGWIDAVPFTRRLLREAAALGADVRLGHAVREIDLDAGVVGCADGATFAADAVVNAAGSAADEIAAMAGARPFLGPARRSLMVHVRLDADVVRHVVRTPEISLRPDGGGRVVMRSDQVDRLLPEPPGGAGPGPDHGPDLEPDPDPEPGLVKDLLDRARRFEPLLGDAEVELAHVVAARCARDGLPSAGPLTARPGYHEAVASAGVTLAPVLGELLAERILTGRADPLLTPFTPDRFTASS